MNSSLLSRSVAILAVVFCSTALAGCGELGSFLSPGVNCDDLSSSEWKSLANGDRKDEAEAIKDCGTLDGMTRTEVKSWMGPPIEKSVNLESKNKTEAWLIGNSPENSDLPMIYVEYGKDGKVNSIRIYGS